MESVFNSGGHYADQWGDSYSDSFASNEAPLSRPSDVPLHPGVSLSTSLEDVFDLGPGRSQRLCEARRCILGNLLSLAAMEQWIFYSRDNNHYASCGGRYVPKYYQRSWIVGAIDQLQSADLVHHEKTRPSPSARYRSRIRPTDRFFCLASAIPESAIRFQPSESIVLRDSLGRPRAYQDTDHTNTMRNEVAEQNEFLASVDVRVKHPLLRYDALGFLRTESSRICPTRKTAYRVFNDSFSLGGRWYGPWWQGLPSDLRTGIQLDSQPTVEEDFSCCHLRLLFALAGDDIKDRDAYGELGLPRAEVKLAIRVMLNAGSKDVGARAIYRELARAHGSSAVKRCQQLMARVYDRFPRLSRYWNTGCGLRLQNVDARICTNVQKRLRRAGIACLSIHDSFIVMAAGVERLRAAMKDELEGACCELRERGLWT